MRLLYNLKPLKCKEKINCEEYYNLKPLKEFIFQIIEFF